MHLTMSNYARPTLPRPFLPLQKTLGLVSTHSLDGLDSQIAYRLRCLAFPLLSNHLNTVTIGQEWSDVLL